MDWFLHDGDYRHERVNPLNVQFCPITVIVERQGVHWGVHYEVEVFTRDSPCEIMMNGDNIDSVT